MVKDSSSAFSGGLPNSVTPHCDLASHLEVSSIAFATGTDSWLTQSGLQGLKHVTVSGGPHQQ